jgi:hypothetical protein
MSGLLRRLRLRQGPSERGSSVVEVVILAPALGLFLALIIAGGRVAVAHQAVEASALKPPEPPRSPAPRARPQASQKPQRGQPDQPDNPLRQHCRDRRHRAVSPRPVGTPASVGATVTCQVDLAGLLPGLPGSMSITATVRSPLDTYRER